MSQMVIDSKYPNEGFDSSSVSSELIASDELIVDIDLSLIHI